MSRYEVHHFTLADGWINSWTIANNDGEETPDSFVTLSDAQAELNDFFMEIESEIHSGERPFKYAYERDEYRIFDTKTKNYVG